ncbi:hypothetical protein LCGC14_1024990 [marine sediment metagenome]|uniref:Uncharacterized protein n=1 Tax=marine sediment metagenome TaxID=412755 RepID=A0A0F9N0U3_9ZZZZ
MQEQHVEVKKHLTPSQRIVQYFKYEHLPPKLKDASKPFCVLAHQLEETLPDGPEKTFCLRQLLIAKDAGVRSAMEGE